jgi:hypothetical protein
MSDVCMCVCVWCVCVFVFVRVEGFCECDGGGTQEMNRDVWKSNLVGSSTICGHRRNQNEGTCSHVKTRFVRGYSFEHHSHLQPCWLGNPNEGEIWFVNRPSAFTCLQIERPPTTLTVTSTSSVAGKPELFGRVYPQPGVPGPSGHAVQPSHLKCAVSLNSVAASAPSPAVTLLVFETRNLRLQDAVQLSSIKVAAGNETLQAVAVSRHSWVAPASSAPKIPLFVGCGSPPINMPPKQPQCG